MQPKILDLNAQIPEIEKMLLRLIGEDVTLLTRLSPGLGNVKIDPGQIDQIIMNLVINARDAMPQGGKIIIETANVELDDTYVSEHLGAKSGAYVMLAVSDTGTGMDAATRARVFEPFFTTKEQGKGTGLGLATVYGIVKQNSGSIWVYSEPGQGTTFKIYIPRVEEEADTVRASDMKQPMRGGKETILLAEDDEMVRAFAHHVLETNGYSMLSAANGTEALAECRKSQFPIHLMITDTVMPGLNGRELAEQVVALHPEMRVLFVSGYTDDIILEHGILKEGVDFLPKPFTPDVLMRKVRELLDRSESRG